jgi:transcriptional regulator NrdR family protein
VGGGIVSGPVTDQNALTDDEREQRCRQEQISHEHYTRETVEAIVAARVAQVTADRDRWKIQRDAVFRGFKTALAERDALVEKIRAIADQMIEDDGGCDQYAEDLRAVLPSTGDHTPEKESNR